MHDISPLSNGSVTRGLTGARQAGDEASSRAEPRARVGDRVELSDRARGAEAGTTPAGERFRPDLVERVRGEIAAGTYETDVKVAIAASKLSGSVDVTA